MINLEKEELSLLVKYLRLYNGFELNGELEAYMMSLNYDKVREIECIRYLGSPPHDEVTSPSKQYDHLKKSLIEDTKEITVLNLIGKSNFLTTFLKGCELLNIEVE